MFTETVTVVTVSLQPAMGAMPGGPATTPAVDQFVVTLRQPNGNQFTITDVLANASKYNVGEELPHSIG